MPVATVAILVAGLTVALAGRNDTPGTAEAVDGEAEGQVLDAVLPAPAAPGEGAGAGAGADALDDRNSASSGGSDAASAPETTSGVPTPPRVELVGDSLLESATNATIQAMPEAVLRIDAETGRTLSGGLAALQLAVEAEPDAVIIALGTNDWAVVPEQFAAHLDEAAALLRGVPCVVWVDVQEFRPELESVNDALAAEVATMPSSYLARWSAVAGPAALHAADGYHLSEAGQAAFAQLIATAHDVWCTDESVS